MAGTVSSNVNFNFTGNASGLNSALQSIGNSATNASGMFDELLNVLGDTGDAGDIASNVFKVLTDSIGKSIDVCTEITGLLANGVVDGFEMVYEVASQMGEALKAVNEQLTEFVEQGSEINQAYFGVYNYMGSEAGQEIVNYTNSLQELMGLDADAFVGKMDGILGTVSNMGLGLEEATEKVKEFSRLALDLSAFSGYDVEDITSRLEAAVSLGSLNITSPLVKALNITKDEIDAFRDLNTIEERAQFLLSRGESIRGTYERWLQTAAGKAEVFKNSLSIINGEISKFALGLFAQVAPALTLISNVIIGILSSLNSLLGFDLSVANANSVADQYNDIAEGISSVGTAAEKAERKTASFDDVIQISDSGSSSGLGSSIADAQLLSDLLSNIGDTQKQNNALFEKWGEIISNDIKMGNFEDAGANFGRFLYELMNQINWSDINNNIKSFSTGLSDFFNGLISNKNTWSKAGETIGNSFNAITLSIKTFFENFNGAEFGDSIGLMWKTMWETFDEQQAADALYEVFMDIFDTVGGFLEQGGFSKMADSLVGVIEGFFSNITDEDINSIVETISSLISDVLLSGLKITDTLDTSGEDNNPIMKFIKRAAEEFNENSGTWGKALGDIVKNVLDFIITAFETADGEGVNNGIYEFINGLDLYGIFTRWLKISWELIKLETASVLSTMGTFVTEFILSTIENILYVSSTSIKMGYAIIWAAVEIGIIQPFTKLWDSLSAVLGELWTNFKTWWNTHFGGKSLIDITIPNWIPAVGGKTWDFKIPALATGGIVTRPTMTITGDAGAEAVLPLERNTQWMDNLANKIASRIGNSNNAVTIDLSKCQKPFYTRSEMLETGEYIGQCLKLAGMNVSVVM
jgi:hypothetical protein